MTQPLALLLCALLAVAAGCKDAAKAPAPAASKPTGPAAVEAAGRAHEGVDEAVRRAQEAAERARAAGVEIVNAAQQGQTEAEIAAAKARAVANEAVKAATAARERIPQLEQGAVEMTNRIDEMLAAVSSAQNEAERVAARAKLAVLQKANAELAAELAAVKAQVAKAERLEGTTVSKECRENPLAKGCQ
jgi:hypothetical protein